MANLIVSNPLATARASKPKSKKLDLVSQRLIKSGAKLSQLTRIDGVVHASIEGKNVTWVPGGFRQQGQSKLFTTLVAAVNFKKKVIQVVLPKE